MEEESNKGGGSSLLERQKKWGSIDDLVQLHWREERNFDSLLEERRRQWIGRMCCGSCGGVPCPVDHEEEKRKRLVDLNFVKDLVLEKKQMEADLEKMKADILSMSERENEWKIEKLMLLRQLKEKEEKEAKWMKEKEWMQREIGRLKEANEEMQQVIQRYKKNEGKLEMLSLRVEGLVEENDRLKDDNKRLRKENSYQLIQIQQTAKEKAEIKEELYDANTKLHRLRIEMDEINEKYDALRNDQTKDDLIKDLKHMMNELNQERDDLLHQSREQEEIIFQLQGEMKAVTYALEATSEELATTKTDLNGRIFELEKEVERLRKLLRNDTGFKKFVSVKRELNDVKEKNATLKMHVWDEQKDEVLTLKALTMKADGRVSSSRSSAKKKVVK